MSLACAVKAAVADGHIHMGPVCQLLYFARLAYEINFRAVLMNN